MSLTLAVNDTLSVRHNFSSSSGKAFNLLHYRVASISGTTPALATGLAKIAQELYDTHSELWGTNASIQVIQTGTTVTNMWPLPRSAGFTYTPGTPHEGEIEDEALPLQDSVTILKRTAVGNRWGLGRVYFVGLAENQQNAGKLTVGAITTLALYVAHLGQPLTITGTGWSVTLQPVIVTWTKGVGVTRSTDVLSTSLSDDILKTQRRRRPGKGI